MAEEKVVVRGLEGVIAAETRVSVVDGVNGELIYNGYDIHELAGRISYAEAVHLLWYNKLPNIRELELFRARLVGEMRLPAPVIKLIELCPPNSPPMSVLRTAVSMLGMDDPDAEDQGEAALERKRTRLLAQVFTIVAALYRVRNRLPILSPDPKMSVTSNFLYMFHGRAPEDHARGAFDLAMVLMADHGLNASTFAARVTTSTLADMHSALVTAIGTLKGPLHGGANEKAMEMVEEVGDPKRVEEYIDGMLAQKERVMGFGHRVYKVEDPRARHLRTSAEEMCKITNKTHLFEICHGIERVVMDRKGIHPNVDFYSAVVQSALGIPKEYFTCIFAMSRTAGWLAHIIEQRNDNRLIRPTSRYVGPRGLTWLPLEERA